MLIIISIVLIMVIFTLLLINCSKEFFVDSYDNDNILSDRYSNSNFKSENKFTKFLFERNRKYNNIFKGSVLNKYFNLIKPF